jgi:GAF domain-containing protein
VEGSAHLAAHFAEISREFSQTENEELTFQRISERAVDIVPACDFVGITLRGGGRRAESVAVTDPLAQWCDDLQYELDEGPCLDAAVQEETYLIDDVAKDPRWPRWGRRVAEAGVGSVLSIQMTNDTGTLGALNLYSRRTHAFDEDSIDLALVYASHAASAISSAKLVTGLRTALQSRHLIGVAQGILMSRYDMSLDVAFEVLRRYSSHTNTKLRDVAATVVERRRLPDGYGDVAGRGPGSGPPSTP